MKHGIVLHDLMLFAHRPLLQMKADRLVVLMQKQEGTGCATHQLYTRAISWWKSGIHFKFLLEGKSRQWWSHFLKTDFIIFRGNSRVFIGGKFIWVHHVMIYFSLNLCATQVQLSVIKHFLPQKTKPLDVSDFEFNCCSRGRKTLNQTPLLGVLLINHLATLSTFLNHRFCIQTLQHSCGLKVQCVENLYRLCFH